MKKGVIIFILGLFVTSLLALVKPPVSIHLSLASDTLALAEPVMLTFEFQNDTNKDLAFYKGIFPQYRIPGALYLILITPDGESLTYQYVTGFHMQYALDAEIYYVVPPGITITYPAFLWWDVFFAKDEVVDLRAFCPGHYKLYAIYPNFAFLKEVTEADTVWSSTYGDNIYCSDTVDFVFLPSEGIDSLALGWMNELANAVRWPQECYSLCLESDSKAYKTLEYLLKSPSSYNEASYVRFMLDILPSYWLDSFKASKADFNDKHPFSPFEPMLLSEQLRILKELESMEEALEDSCVSIGLKNIYYDEVKQQLMKIDEEFEVDSLTQELETLIPNHVVVLESRGKIGHATLREVRGQ